MHCDTLPDTHIPRPSLHLEGRPSLDEVLLKYIVQTGVQLLLHILDQQGVAQGEAVLQVAAEVFVVEVGGLHLSAGLLVFDPRLGLTLGEEHAALIMHAESLYRNY